MSTDRLLRVTVVYSPAPRVVKEWPLSVAVGTTVAQALAMVQDSGIAGGDLGIWNKPVAPDHVLHDADRIEVYRPLKVDPKVARRERFEKQGRRSTGLFARKPTDPADVKADFKAGVAADVGSDLSGSR